MCICNKIRHLNFEWNEILVKKGMHSNINIWHINKKSWTLGSSYHRKVFFGAGPRLDFCLPGRRVGPWEWRMSVRDQAWPQAWAWQWPAPCLLLPHCDAGTIMSHRPWDHRRAHHPCEVSWAAPPVWGRPTVLPPCEEHSWSPTHVARMRGASGRADGNFARASGSQSMLTPQPFSSSPGRTVSLSAWPLSVVYARLGRGRGSARPTFSLRPHRWVLRAASLQPGKEPLPWAPSSAHASWWHQLNPGAPTVRLQDIRTSVEGLTDCSPSGSAVHGVCQAGTLEQVAISFSRDLPNPATEPMPLVSHSLASWWTHGPAKSASEPRPEAKDLGVAGSEFKTLCLGPLQTPDVAVMLTRGKNRGNPTLHWRPRKARLLPTPPWSSLVDFQHPGMLPSKGTLEERISQLPLLLMRNARLHLLFPWGPAAFASLQTKASPSTLAPPRTRALWGKQDCGHLCWTSFIYWALSFGNIIL